MCIWDRLVLQSRLLRRGGLQVAIWLYANIRPIRGLGCLEFISHDIELVRQSRTTNSGPPRRQWMPRHLEFKQPVNGAERNRPELSGLPFDAFF